MCKNFKTYIIKNKILTSIVVASYEARTRE